MAEETKKGLKAHWKVCLICFFVFVLSIPIRRNFAPETFVLFVISGLVAFGIEIWDIFNGKKGNSEEAAKPSPEKRAKDKAREEE